MSVTTKTGDGGKTSLYTGERVDKGSLRVETYGTIDEVGSALAMARAFSARPEIQEQIYVLQKELTLLMADFASLGSSPRITEEHIRSIEQRIYDAEATLPPIKVFLVPGDTKAGAMLDLARATARRAERCACRLAAEEEVADTDRRFLNRLSDYCFLLVRLEER